MNRNSIRNVLSVVGVFVLIAAMALNFTGCSSNSTPETTPETTRETVPETTQTTPETTVETVAGITFTLVVTDLEGNETTIEVITDKTFVGEALLEEGVITGDEGPYGLYINTVNGITASWDADQTYWAFYVDGEYALTGVDTTQIDPDCVYSLVLTKG